MRSQSISDVLYRQSQDLSDSVGRTDGTDGRESGTDGRDGRTAKTRIRGWIGTLFLPLYLVVFSVEIGELPRFISIFVTLVLSDVNLRLSLLFLMFCVI